MILKQYTLESIINPSTYFQFAATHCIVDSNYALIIAQKMTPINMTIFSENLNF